MDLIPKKGEKLKEVFESKVESQKLFEVLKIVQNLTHHKILKK